jgi:hypothetical protein
VSDFVLVQRGELVVTLNQPPSQTSEELAKIIHEAVNSPDIEVFRVNFKAKTSQLTISFKAKAAAAQAPAKAASPAAANRAKSPGAKEKKQGDKKSDHKKKKEHKEHKEEVKAEAGSQSKLYTVADEIVKSVLKKLENQEEAGKLSGGERQDLEVEVRNILGRFQTWAYVEGFEAKTGADQLVKLQSSLK